VDDGQPGPAGVQAVRTCSWYSTTGQRRRSGAAAGAIAGTPPSRGSRRCGLRGVPCSTCGAGFTDRELVHAGAAVPGRHGGVIDAVRHRLVVPLIERGVDGGGVVGSTARRLSDADTAGPKWVNTATTALYRKSEHLFGAAQQADLIAAGRGRPVLVEGAVDAIAVNLAGHIGLAADGTRLTTHHATALGQVRGATGGQLLLADDSDPAGQDRDPACRRPGRRPRRPRRRAPDRAGPSRRPGRYRSPWPAPCSGRHSPARRRRHHHPAAAVERGAPTAEWSGADTARWSGLAVAGRSGPGRAAPRPADRSTCPVTSCHLYRIVGLVSGRAGTRLVVSIHQASRELMRSAVSRIRV